MVILVDKEDKPLGTEEKQAAHEKGLLHRAFSVFIFNAEGKLLLQRRAARKYHSPGLWTNTCCSHPKPGESTEQAAYKRLEEEMGIRTPLKHQLTFCYRAPFTNGLTEYEIDHVFVGYTDQKPILNEEETDEYRYVTLEEVNEDIRKNPEDYTVWFRIILERYMKDINLYKKTKRG